MKWPPLKSFAFVFFVIIACCKTKNATPVASGSGIPSINLTPFKVDNLALLGRVWGFLKYYHPTIAKGKYNWDHELFKILPKIIECESEQSRNDILAAWIESFGTCQKDTICKIDSSRVKSFPDIDWISNNLKLGNKLSTQLINIKRSKRIGENYYVKLMPGPKNPVFTNEDSCQQYLYPDVGYRLLCLFRYWNCIEYFYPNKHLIEGNWPALLKLFIPKFVNTKNELDYKLTVLELISSIHDTHADMICEDSTWINYRGKYSSEVQVSFIENKVVVTGYYNKELGERSGLEIGDIILKIKNKSVDSIIIERLPHTLASNYPTALRNITWSLFRSNDSLLDVIYQRDTKTKSLILKCTLIEQLKKNYLGYHRDTCFKYLSKNIGYFLPGNFKDEYLKGIMPEILKTKALVIDFRCYPSDDILTSFIDNFLSKRTPYLRTSNADIKMPGLFIFSPIYRIGFRNPNSYKGKIIVLVNELTQSQAEWDVMALQTIPNSIVLGSTTAGADGNVSVINLIGGIKTHISGRGVYYPDGRETQRVGIIPDIEIHPTIEGIREGRDELLEKALEIINLQ
jgi:hypothetical protein